MNDLISRKALLDALCTVSAPTPSESWIVEKCIEKVNDAPAVEAEPKWIPVTERLPTIYDADADNCVLAIHKASNKRYYHWRSVADNPFDFTHWMETPQPPKGE